MKAARAKNDNAEVLVLDVDPRTVVKTIAAGICAAGIALLERRRGQPALPPANDGSDVMTADEVAALLRLDRKTVYELRGPR